MRRFTIQERITARDCDSLDLYLKEINNSKYDPISAEEEIKLAIEIKNGSEESMQKLVNANVRFAVSVAKAYQGHGLTLSDLINEANIGLIKSAKKFDETRGFKFISYAVWWVRQSILQAMAEQGRMIRLPMNQVNTMTKVNKAYSELEQDLGRVPSASEIAEKLEIEVDDVALISQHKSKMKSFSSPINDEESSTLEDVISDDNDKSTDDTLLMESLKMEIDKALGEFSDRDKEVIKLSFGIGRDFAVDDEEIAEKYGLTRERIRQIKKNVARTLSTNETLRSFLG